MASRLLFGLIASTLAFAAHAQFIVLDPSTAPQYVRGNGPAVVRINNADTSSVQTVPPMQQQVPSQAMPRGAAPMQQAVIPGTGLTSLKDTLKKIVPSGWNAYIDRNLSAALPVDYIPSGDWKSALRTLSNRYNLVFNVDNDGKKIFVDAGPGGARDMQSERRPAAGSVPVAAAQPAQAPAASLRLEVRDGQRLSEALRQFLAAGNWNLVWEAGSDAVLPRGFVSTGSNMKSILDEVLPHFRMHALIHQGNNTVVVVSNTPIGEQQ